MSSQCVCSGEYHNKLGMAQAFFLWLAKHPKGSNMCRKQQTVHKNYSSITMSCDFFQGLHKLNVKKVKLTIAKIILLFQVYKVSIADLSAAKLPVGKKKKR